MKKIFKLLALTVISIALVNLAGCKKKSSSTATTETETETPTIETTFDKGTSDSATFN